jgi:hypothetical protein
MASSKESQQLITACWISDGIVWILKRHAGVAAIEELAHVWAGQPDVMAIFRGI